MLWFFCMRKLLTDIRYEIMVSKRLPFITQSQKIIKKHNMAI